MKHGALVVVVALIAGCRCDHGADPHGARSTGLPSTPASGAPSPPATPGTVGVPPAWAPSLPFRDVAMTSGLACVADAAGEVGCLNDGGRRWRPPRASGPVDQLAMSQLELCALSLGDVSCVGIYGDALLPEIHGVAEIALSDGARCARGVDGAVRCWKRGGAPALVPGVEGATAVAVGGDMACAIVGGGSIRCWSHASSRAAPLAGIERADEVACGGSACCARSQGSVACWGGNLWGQLGRAKGGRSESPVVIIGVANARSIAVGWAHECAALADGSVLCWGRGDELGRWGEACPAHPGSCASLTTCEYICRTPVRIDGVSDAVRLVAGHGTCALRGAAPPLCWGGSVSTYGAPASMREPVPFTW